MSFNRRDFLKFNLLLLASPLMLTSEQNSVAISNHISIFDILNSLPFSKEIKKEIGYRIWLQKKYGYDALKREVPLHRFHKENLNFILYQGNMNDIILYHSHVPTYLDYVIVRSAYYNKMDVLHTFTTQLLGYDQELHARAIFAALANKAITTFCFLMKSNIYLSPVSHQRIYNILCSERYHTNISQLSKMLPHMHIQPTKRTKLKLSYDFNEELENFDTTKICYETIQQWITILLNCLQYILEGMEENREIDSFSAFIENNQIHIQTYKHVYPIDFIQSINASFSQYIPRLLYELVQNYEIVQFSCE